MSMKNSNDTIGNRTPDLPACSVVPQPTATPSCTLLRVGDLYISLVISKRPVPVAGRSKVWVCGLSLSGTVSSNPTGGMDVCLL